jgi:alcohol dehydrogenase class IV
MAINFEFATAQQIIFGNGKANNIASLAQTLGQRALVVTSKSNPRVQTLLNQWQSQGLVAATLTANGEPTVEEIIHGTSHAREAACDLIIAIGGGSVIDTGKAIAALLTNPGDPLDYLEVVGKGQPLHIASAPLIAAPTTAGTGAEVTRNAVLSVPDQQVKVSLRSPNMLPRIALIDPELTHSMPSKLTASTGLDALTQCIEPFVSNQANPITDGIAREGIQAAARSLLTAVQDGGNDAARTDMALASLCGGLALANAKLGAVHGFAGILGGMFPIPHGTVCACLLPHVLAANVTALTARDPDSPILARFDQVAQLVTGEQNATAQDAVEWIQALCTKLQISPLSAFGVTPGDFGLIVTKSQQASSMKGNPITLSHSELHKILSQAF